VKYNSNSGFVATQPLPPPPPSSSRAPDSSNATTATTADLLLPTNGTTNTTTNNSNNDSGTSSPSGSPKKQQQQHPLVRQLSKQLSLSRQSSGLSEVNNIRHTPQAFSHFSYAFTQGTALCVDIQGVADLYTDPQIHTLDGQGYGGYVALGR
jgi:LAS superfamily LD-carboxypeptidase LdcB